jgi:hypothetical protein
MLLGKFLSIHGEFSPPAIILNPQHPWWPFSLQLTALHMGITKTKACGYNIFVSLRPHHDCGDGVFWGGALGQQFCSFLFCFCL